MNFKKYSLLISSFLLIFMYGCKQHAVRDVVNAHINGHGHYHASDVKRIILRAGSDLGWGMRPEGHGVIVGTIIVRRHRAQIRITYNRNSYSIHYVSSEGLNYRDGHIHSGYNGWITNLEARINTLSTTL